MSILRALFLAAPLAYALPGAAQTLLLRFKPPVGKTTSYTMTMSMTTSSSMMPAPMSFTQTLPMTSRVVSRAGTTTTMQNKTGQAKVSAPANSPIASMKAQIEKMSSGTTTTTQVDELGNIKSVSAKGGSGAAMAQSMGQGMMQGAQGLSFPKKALKVGDTWTATMDLGKAGGAMSSSMKMTGTIPIVYKLAALKGGVATISMTLKGATSMSMGANAMKMVLNGKGSMTVDAATGLLKAMTSTTDTDMNLGGRGTMRQHMVMTMKAG